MKIAMLVWLALVASAVPAFAQEQELVLGPEFEQRFDELAKWLKEYEAWEKWFEVWGNRVAHNFDDQPIWERKKRPEPPVWLEAECQGYLVADGLLASCLLHSPPLGRAAFAHSPTPAFVVGDVRRQGR